MTDRVIDIKDYDYDLPEDRIAKFPPSERGSSKLLYWNGTPCAARFCDAAHYLPEGSTLVFNNTRVIRARLVFFKPSGARIEIFCLEPHNPSDHERAFAATGCCEWMCMVGNSRKWKEGALECRFNHNGTEHILKAERVAVTDKEHTVRFKWDDDTLSFGRLLEMLGRIPIPPYLNRDSCEEDNTRYQTVYSRVEGSVAAPTAGLHFTDAIMESIRSAGHPTTEVTLHVGAGTFLPVKSDNAAMHPMHTEHFSVTLDTVEMLIRALSSGGVIAVGTTTVRTLESLPAIGYRIIKEGDPCCHRTIGQWECYHIDHALDGTSLLQAVADHMRRDGVQRLDCSTRIMITPPYKWRVVRGMFTNFHQPQSTLLLLVSALIGPAWRDIYRFAADNGFKFLSYGDSSLLIPPSDPCL